MSAVTFINVNESNSQVKQFQRNNQPISGEFIRDPHKIVADEEAGELSDERDPNDLYDAFRSFLILGKFIGLIPIEGLFQRDVDKLTFNKSSFPAIVSLTISGTLIVNVVMGFVGLFRGVHTNAGEYAWAPRHLLFFFIGFFAFLYFYRHVWDYIQILRKWNKINLTFTMPDTTLRRDLNGMALLVMTSAILENMLLTINQFPIVPEATDSLTLVQMEEPQNASALQIYYIRSNESWAAFVPFHPLLAVFLFVTSKIDTYAWNYLDLTIAFLSRALYYKFKALYKQSERLLVARESACDAAKWKQLTYDLEILCSMLFDVKKFLSPIVFCSFGINVYFICLQLKFGLTPTIKQPLTQTIYAVWSVLHLITRVFILSLCASRINEWAHKLSEIFLKCPIEAFTIEVERAERFVSLNTIGLNGLGSFVVTKPLMLQLAGVVLTFEIVLLQFSQSTWTGPCSN